MAPMPSRVFLDSSAVFAAIVSATGGARQIMRLGEAGHADVLVSGAVLSEVERTVREKAPAMVAALALLLHAARVSVVAEARKTDIARVSTWLDYAPDARVLAAAARAAVDFFVTLDRKHFLDNARLRQAMAFPVGTPGDYLAWYRARADRAA